MDKSSVLKSERYLEDSKPREAKTTKQESGFQKVIIPRIIPLARPHAIRCTRLEEVRRGSRTLEEIAVEMGITNASEEVADVPLKEEGQ
ncbi:hypothetical protein NC652_030628 [Populus alba x Populus x berolinensis]|nr:hypothetical protein NC652_030628 [Populus alba x Populus x berolinensis]